MKTKVCVAGATGKVGQGIVRAVLASDDLELVGAIARGAAGKPVDGAGDLHVTRTAEEALATPRGVDVFVDYTRADAARPHAHAAIAHGVHVVIGSSGLTDDDYAGLDEAARAKGVGVFAAGNFAITAVLLQRFAVMAAKYAASWEVIDYAYERKPDAPSGTARELATKLSAAKKPAIGHPIADTLGERSARGATLAGAQFHSVRIPGYSSSIEVLLGLPGERLTLRHDAIDPTAPYVGGTLLAVRRVQKLVGVVRGLDALLSD